MKRLTALLLAGVLALGCAACGNTNNGGSNNGSNNGTENNKPGTENSSEPDVSVEIKDANEILTKVWDEYMAKVSDDLKLMVGGGNVENMVESNAGKFDTTLEGAMDMLQYTFCAPADTVAKTDDVATLMSMMNANQLSAAAYHVTNAADVEAVINSIKEATLGNQWMCGFPEKLIIVTVGEDYVVSAYGNGMVIDALKTAITTVYGDAAKVSVETAVTE